MRKIIGIVAIAENGAIGNRGGIPWNSKSDITHFKERTKGNAIVMGRKTYESIGYPLPNRLNIVLTKTPTINLVMDDDGNRLPLVVYQDKQQVLDLVKHLYSDMYIIGGTEIYSLFKDDIQKWIITEVPLSPDADVFLNKDFLKDFRQSTAVKLEDGLVVKTYERKN